MKFQFLKASACCLALSLSLLVSNAHAGLIFDNTGQITGAEDVLVNGVMYDLLLVDGQCADIYDGCDDNQDFTFKSESEGNIASGAFVDLLDAYFLAQADYRPNQLIGCEDSNTCVVFTPFTIIDIVPLNFKNSYIVLQTTKVYVQFTYGRLLASYNSAESPKHVFVSWKKSAAIPEAPEPTIFAVFALGLIGLGFRRFNKQA